ncbi:hypothetical protein Taro_035069 [Colocasia esculenta]|uniref:Uncharacterized protein n=1 Tax=Colocasia esculenta TaxID=4460 RepID=A0A843VTA2_COLES|nr:hypothetical protein [Colocasia esculenta]
MEGDTKEKSGRPEESAVSPTTTAAEEGEEEQMARFFALLKNVREMREQWRRRVVDDRPTKRPKVERPPWTPTFQWEDFAGVAGLDKRPAATPTTSGVTEGEEEKKEETGPELRMNRHGFVRWTFFVTLETGGTGTSSAKSRLLAVTRWSHLGRRASYRGQSLLCFQYYQTPPPPPLSPLSCLLPSREALPSPILIGRPAAHQPPDLSRDLIEELVEREPEDPELRQKPNHGRQTTAGLEHSPQSGPNFEEHKKPSPLPLPTRGVNELSRAE